MIRLALPDGRFREYAPLEGRPWLPWIEEIRERTVKAAREPATDTEAAALLDVTVLLAALDAITVDVRTPRYPAVMAEGSEAGHA